MKRFKLEMIFEMGDDFDPPDSATLIQGIAPAVLGDAPAGTSMTVLQPPVLFEVTEDDI